MRGGVSSRIVLPLEEEDRVAPGPGNPLLKRRPPVLARAEHPGNEDVREAALAQMRGDRLDQLAAPGVGALVLLRGEHARRVGDDEPVRMACERLKVLSLDRFEIV